MKITEVVKAYGHANIIATHKTTFEITKETTLSKRGNCIIAVESTKGASDLRLLFKEAARKKDAQITIMISSGGITDVVRAKGNPNLSFTHPTDLVVRKSDFVCGRTIAVRADKAASEVSRKLIRETMIPHQKILVKLIVKS